MAKTQAFDYIGDLTRANRWDEIPRFVLVSDFARFVRYDLEPEEQRDLPLFDGRKVAHYTSERDIMKVLRSLFLDALRTDWNTVLPSAQCSYVLGNPPFIGKHYQSGEQRADMVHVFGDFPNTGDLDYVTCWYRKAAEYITGGRATVPGLALEKGSAGFQPAVSGIPAGQRAKAPEKAGAGAQSKSSRQDAGKGGLEARAPPPRGMSTLADLYDPLTMPAALAKAHAELDRAVERCYRRGGGGEKGQSDGGRDEPFRSDRERVEHLFALYEKRTTLFLTPKTKTRTHRPPAAPSSRPRRNRPPGLPDASAESGA